MQNFLLYGELGRGSSSVVYKGRKTGSLNYVAIICTDKTKRAHIINHVRWSSFLDHPNIVSFYDWCETTRQLWLIVELCSGGSLETMISQDECLPEEVVRELGWGLVKGLKHIHDSGIIFSGFTPAKIYLDISGSLKLGDFSLAKVEGERLEEFFSLMSTCQDKQDRESKESCDHSKRRCQGPPAFSAPEVLQGSETSKSSDLWALGCILYYMYTGKPPFYSENFSQLIEMILHQEPPPPRQTGPSSTPPSEEFQSLLRGLLQKSAEKRLDWPELLGQPFWAPMIEEEKRKMEEEKEGDGQGHDSGRPKSTQTEASLPQPEKLPAGKTENKQPTSRASKPSSSSSQPKTAPPERTSGRAGDSKQAERHASHAASRVNPARRKKKVGERREEREADTEDKAEASQTKQSCHSVRPNKSFTIDHRPELRAKGSLAERSNEPFFLHRKLGAATSQII